MNSLSVLLLLLGIVIQAQSASYYISPTGSNSNEGTSAATPWKTTGPINAIRLKSGDQVLFESGVDHYPGCLYISSGGTPTSPVIVSSYGNNGNARLHVNGSEESAVNVFDTGGVEISELTIIGSDLLFNADFAGIGINSYNTSLEPDLPRFPYIYIHDSIISGFEYGVSFYSAGCSGFSDVTVANVVVSENWMIGISTSGPYTDVCYAHANITVSNCTAFNNTGNPSVTSSWTGSGIVLSGVNGASVTNSLAYGNGMYNAHLAGGPCGIWAWDANAVIISHCVSHSNLNGQPSSQMNDGCGFDLDGGCSNSVVEYSFSFNNAGPGMLFCQFGGNVRPTVNNSFLFSVSYNDGQSSVNGAAGLNFFSPDDTMSNLFVQSSTFFSNNSNPVVSPVAGSSSFSNTLLLHNVFIASASGDLVSMELSSSPPNFNLSGNAYWSVQQTPVYAWQGKIFTSLSQFSLATGQETQKDGEHTGIDSDPQLESDGDFFQSCVKWENNYPSIPNSPLLNQLRGFSACS